VLPSYSSSFPIFYVSIVITIAILDIEG